ncbi:TolC family protein [Criblamydia sequanensis]|uniref:Secreted protein n=1 Tax=Candidatus Criblamydia sequanensis CRIB-18 TaxID=1437425 RepID=A0A090CZC8_9BACT|nr:TolC family protein [Criblamydia sequanensis]CDR34367.1 putative secreted protein [Criblamydia sequanensis CRIB-18]
MIAKLKRLFLFILFSAFSYGCYRPCNQGVEVHQVIEESLGKDVFWQRNPNSYYSLEEYLAHLAEDPLKIDNVIQIALLNSPRIQALLEEVGMAKADLFESYLLSNPALDLLIKYPRKKDLYTNLEWSLTQSIVDILLRPLRIKLASVDLQKVKLKITHEIQQIAFEVSDCFYKLQTKEQALRFLETIRELSSIRMEIADRQYRVGDTYLLSVAKRHAPFYEAEIEISHLGLEIISLKEQLNRLLGFCEEKSLNLSLEFEEVDYQGLSLECLEALAFQERLDLQALRYEVIYLSQSLGLKRWWVYTQGRLGVAQEIDTDGTHVFGPAIVLDIPIFNYGQAERQRLYASLRQAEDELKELEIKVLSEVREAHHLLLIKLDQINSYRGIFLPLVNQIVSLGEERYNIMSLGIDELLEKKIEELKLWKDYTQVLGSYWDSRVSLDKAIGGNLYLILNKNKAPFLDGGL